MNVVILRWNPEISSYSMDSFKNAMEEAKNTAYETMMKCYDRNIYDWGTIKNRVRDDVSKLMYERTKRSPMILPILMEI